MDRGFESLFVISSVCFSGRLLWLGGESFCDGLVLGLLLLFLVPLQLFIVRQLFRVESFKLLVGFPSQSSQLNYLHCFKPESGVHCRVPADTSEVGLQHVQLCLVLGLQLYSNFLQSSAQRKELNKIH